MTSATTASRPPDKYSAVWISYSALSEFGRCPQAYYLQYIYKDPQTRRKPSIMAPPLALGQAVHNTLEPLAKVPAAKRLEQPIQRKFETEWQKVSGRQGGFKDETEERELKERGREMLKRVADHPGPLNRPAVRISPGPSGMPPNFYLSEKDNIILCGSIDWLEYLPETDSVSILDFKTGRHDEKDDSLQLPIYLLLARNLQKRPVAGAAYWYLDRAEEPEPKDLPEYKEAEKAVLAEARKIKAAREKKEFACPRGEEGCFSCRPLKRVLSGEGEYLGVNEMNKDVYILPAKQS